MWSLLCFVANTKSATIDTYNVTSNFVEIFPVNIVLLLSGVHNNYSNGYFGASINYLY